LIRPLREQFNFLNYNEKNFTAIYILFEMNLKKDIKDTLKFIKSN